MSLSEQTCSPPKEGDIPFSSAQAEQMRREAPGWSLEGGEIKREFQFMDFREAMKFVNGVAEIAEAQGHHPDIFITYKSVRLTLTTHKIGGLSQNDFIMAARIDQLSASLPFSKANH